jgi:hypothetical protein
MLMRLSLESKLTKLQSIFRHLLPESSKSTLLLKVTQLKLELISTLLTPKLRDHLPQPLLQQLLKRQKLLPLLLQPQLLHQHR